MGHRRRDCGPALVRRGLRHLRAGGGLLAPGLPARTRRYHGRVQQRQPDHRQRLGVACGPRRLLGLRHGLRRGYDGLQVQVGQVPQPARDHGEREQRHCLWRGGGAHCGWSHAPMERRVWPAVLLPSRAAIPQPESCGEGLCCLLGGTVRVQALRRGLGCLHHRQDARSSGLPGLRILRPPQRLLCGDQRPRQLVREPGLPEAHERNPNLL
mmetsp:Transcript_77454/g.185670  ORF Transcript_77454/g.185670 Transcript_77454/m.185670 type:complete len:211 (+) Transcript_77454:1185-1817(+)